MGWFKKRLYDTAQVIKESIYDECGIVIKKNFYIEYDTIYLGFIKKKEIFFKWNCGISDCFTENVVTHSKKDILKKFNKFLIDNKKTFILVEKIETVKILNCNDETD